MASAETIKEFLVGLNFKVDEKSLKTFTAGIEGATKGVATLVATISGAALAVSAGVAKFAANMEVLYFSAQKMGASATNVKSFEKAMANFGVSASDAVSSVQSLARWMRETPGSEGFLASLGVQTRDANGNLKDTTELMIGLGKTLGKMNYPMAKQYANLLGISEDTLRAMMSGDFEREMRKQQALLKDAGYEEATRKSQQFMQALRELQTRIEVVGVTIGNSLLKALGPELDAVARWFEQNADSIAEALKMVANVIITLGSIVGPILSTIADGWKNIYQWVKAAGEAIANLLPESVKEKIGAGLDWLFGKLGIRDQMENLVLGTKPSSAASGPPGSTTVTRPQAPAGSADPMAFFMGLGWSKEQAAGIVANLKAESNMNPNAVGDQGSAYGIAQWHPDRQANFAKWAGKDIRQSTAQEQMAFVHHELTEGAERRAGNLLKASRNAAQAGEIVSRYYERPGVNQAAKDAEAAKRAAGAVSIAQNTTINVNGGDAASTGRVVANEQNGVNQQLARNMAGAVS